MLYTAGGWLDDAHPERPVAAPHRRVGVAGVRQSVVTCFEQLGDGAAVEGVGFTVQGTDLGTQSQNLLRALGASGKSAMALDIAVAVPFSTRAASFATLDVS